MNRTNTMTQISYTAPVKIYKPSQILKMTPAKLRRELTAICAVEPELAGKIEAELGFSPRWLTMSAAQYSQVAIAWAKLEDSSFSKFEKLLDLSLEYTRKAYAIFLEVEE